LSVLYKSVSISDLLVAPITGVAATQGEGPETIGTLALRVYITRQLGVSHALTGITKYDGVKGDKAATYKKVAPTLRMTFEENCAPLEKTKTSRELRRMEARRPGTEP
jgi:hypothetical protein